jgi:voltage-gated sodium channel
VASPSFEAVQSSLIVANALFLAWSTDRAAAARSQMADAEAGAVAAGEAIFCLLFVAELSLRIYTYRVRFFLCPAWPWNLMDTVIIAMYVQDQFFSWLGLALAPAASFSVFRMARLARALRAVRIVRLLSVFGELRLLLVSVMGSLKALLWWALMVLVVLFMFSVCFVHGSTWYIQEQQRGAAPGGDPEVV